MRALPHETHSRALVRAFGGRALPLHLLCIVVHGLVGATLFVLVRRLTGQRLVALLTRLLFLSCEDHRLTVGRIATMTPDDDDVLGVRFELDRPLDDAGVLFLQWDGAQFRAFNLAVQPTGARVVLADTSDVWASMW